MVNQTITSDRWTDDFYRANVPLSPDGSHEVRVLFKKGLFLAGVVGILLIYPESSAHADACDSAVSAVNNSIDQSEARFDRIAKQVSSNTVCQLRREGLEFWTEILPLKQQSESACGSRLESQCDSSCAQQHISDARAKVSSACSPARAPVQEVQRLGQNVGQK